LSRIRPDTLFAVAASAFVWLVALPSVAGDKTNLAIGAICRVEQHGEVRGGNPHIAIEDGMGVGGFPIATASRSAQQWFDYGIKLFHAYYHEDAKRAFDNAVAADPRCAMCLWGQALSRGPVQNFDVSEDDMKAGLDFARKALAAARTKREKLLAQAMVRRDSRAQDAPAERDFAHDLLQAEKAGPDTPDLRLLAAEALLTMWRRGDHTIANDAIAIIEPILRAGPNNTAAIHYYIHATERAERPALALPYAEKLSALAPKASHLVHMASHTFLRLGRYEDAATINAFAMRIDTDHLTDTATPGLPSTALYYEHNLRNGMAGALMSGDRALALKFADHLHRVFAEKDFAGDGMREAELQRFAIYARYDPARMLAISEPPADSPQTQAFYHYARAEAFAALHDGAGLAREAAAVTGSDPLIVVAKGVLAGRLAMLQGRFTDAAHAFEAAATQQDSLLAPSMDPPPWWYPVRRSAAAAWLRAGQFASAADTAKASLAGWPRDALALSILAQAEYRLGHPVDARHDDAQAIGSWEGDMARIDIATI